MQTELSDKDLPLRLVKAKKKYRIARGGERWKASRKVIRIMMQELQKWNKKQKGLKNA